MLMKAQDESLEVMALWVWKAQADFEYAMFLEVLVHIANITGLCGVLKIRRCQVRYNGGDHSSNRRCAMVARCGNPGEIPVLAGRNVYVGRFARVHVMRNPDRWQTHFQMPEVHDHCEENDGPLVRVFYLSRCAVTIVLLRSVIILLRFIIMLLRIIVILLRLIIIYLRS